MLQFYLAKIIKRSEFYYADFYYQRYLLNLIASMPSFREKVRLSSLIKTWLQSNKPPNTLYYFYIILIGRSANTHWPNVF